MPRWTSGVRPCPAPPVQRSRHAAWPPIARRTVSAGRRPGLPRLGAPAGRGGGAALESPHARGGREGIGYARVGLGAADAAEREAGPLRVQDERARVRRRPREVATSGRLEARAVEIDPAVGRLPQDHRVDRRGSNGTGSCRGPSSSSSPESSSFSSRCTGGGAPAPTAAAETIVRTVPPSRMAAIATGWSSSGPLVARHGAVAESRSKSPSTTVPPPGSVATRVTAARAVDGRQRGAQRIVTRPAAVGAADVEAVGGGRQRLAPVVGDAREVRRARELVGKVLDVPARAVAAHDQPVAADGGALERIGPRAGDGQQRRLDRQILVV